MTNTDKVPFRKIGNRRMVSFEQMASDSDLKEFVRQFPESFGIMQAAQVAMFIEPKS